MKNHLPSRICRLLTFGGLASLLSISTVKAQFGVGARIGGAASFMHGVNISSGGQLRPGAGLVAGIAGEFRLAQSESLSFFLQTEFALAQKGYGVRITNNDYWLQFNNNFDYLSVPISAKLMFGKNKFKGGINVGAAPSLLVGAIVVARNSEGDVDKESFDRNDIRSYDFNAFISGILEVELGPGALFADIRYTQGFLDPITDKWIKPNPDKTYRHGHFAFSVGYIFRFGSSGGGSPAPVSSADYSTPVLEDFSEPTTKDDSWEQPVKTKPDPVEESNYQRPSEVDEPQSLRVDPQPEPVSEVPNVDFSELIKINKLLDEVADANASDTDRQISKAEVMLKFQSPETPVLIQEGGVTVDYHTITEFLSIIELTHFRYKITDRKMVDGMISEIVMKHIK